MGRPLTSGVRRFWDFRQEWVQEHLAHKMIDLLRECGFGYLKIDYNETIGVGCDGAESLGEGLRSQIEAVQAFMARIRRELPDLVIENCSSGGQRNEPSMMALCSVGCFSDTHECVQIPIIAANMHRVILPRQNLVWCVLRPQDDARRLYYSLAATLLGRMCLSGDITRLPESGQRIVDEAIAFYRLAVPVIKQGFSRRYGPAGGQLRAPAGVAGDGQNERRLRPGRGAHLRRRNSAAHRTARAAGQRAGCGCLAMAPGARCAGPRWNMFPRATSPEQPICSVLPHTAARCRRIGEETRTTMPQESMTPKERWLAVLQRKTPDRVPMDYWGTDETMDILMRHLGCSEPWDVFRKLHIDRVWAVQPEYVGPAMPDDYDVLGCGFRDVSYGPGVYRECVYHPLAQYETVEEVEANYTWPDPDWWDYSCIPDQLLGKEEYPIQGGGSEPFLHLRPHARHGAGLHGPAGQSRSLPSTAWTSCSTWPTPRPSASTSRSPAR